MCGLLRPSNVRFFHAPSVSGVSMGLFRAVLEAVNNFGVHETPMNSVGSSVGYTELETEDQSGDEAPEDWPLRGKIQVNQLEVEYFDGFPPLPIDVSFTDENGKRFGIVGFTGAGKSTHALSPLRLLEDTSRIKLQTLIPQDLLLVSRTVRSNPEYFHQVFKDKLTGFCDVLDYW